MPGPHDYTRGTTAALLTLARGTCYYPSCPVPIFIFVDGKPQPNYTTAHIRAANPNGPRYVREMTDEERRDLPNLVLLCTGHHNAVDGRDRDKYTIELLEKWKSDREKEGLAVLRGLRELTEDRLQEMITEALESQVKKLDEAINRLGQIDPDAASILRGLATGLNPDTVEMLHLATQELRPMLNWDVVEMLHSAANELAPVLNASTADSLSTAAGMLDHSARNLNQSAGTIFDLLDNLSSRIDELRRLQGDI
jgi:hypothetical protein